MPIDFYYTISSPPCRSVLLLAKSLGVELNLKVASPRDGDTKTPEFIKVRKWRYLGSLVTYQNSIQEEIKCRFKAENSCYYSVQTLLSSRLLSKNLKVKI